jgi:hypothetical protein
MWRAVLVRPWYAEVCNRKPLLRVLRDVQVTGTLPSTPMLLRLIIILTLLVQQLALPAVAWSPAQVEECAETSCCQIVETKTCCGETGREMRCGKTGGRECLCGLEPADSEPAPEAPRPADRNEIAPILVALIGSVIELPTPARSQVPPAAPAVVRTHNETQAFLCIWRT